MFGGTEDGGYVGLTGRGSRGQEADRRHREEWDSAAGHGTSGRPVRHGNVCHPYTSGLEEEGRVITPGGAANSFMGLNTHLWVRRSERPSLGKVCVSRDGQSEVCDGEASGHLLAVGTRTCMNCSPCDQRPDRGNGARERTRGQGVVETQNPDSCGGSTRPENSATPAGRGESESSVLSRVSSQRRATPDSITQTRRMQSAL